MCSQLSFYVFLCKHLTNFESGIVYVMRHNRMESKRICVC